MEHERRPRRRLIGGVAGLLLALAACGGLGALLYGTFQASEYPGATRVADGTITSYTPNFAIRRTSVYRTTDSFSKVYNWYSVGFELGPESYAQSNCILMSKSRTRGWGLSEQMSVMVCGTPNDQMMFVMRALIFRYPRL